MTPTLRLLCTNSTRNTLTALAQAYSERAGQSVMLTVDSGKGLVERIWSGETGDAVVLGSTTIQEFAEAGIVIKSSVRPFARTRVGVGVRSGFPKPDISTVDALRTSLLSARAIAHTVHGASGKYIPTLLEKLGIAGEMSTRTVTRPGGYIGPVVVAGEADIALQQLPELLAVEGLDVVGLIPEPIQKVLETSSGIFAASAQSQAAEAMLTFFAEAAHRDLFAAKGLEQVT